MNTSSETDERLHVQLFDGPRIYQDGVEVGLSPHQKCLVALVFGSANYSLTREEIVSILWPSEPPRRARRRLNQLLYSLRKKFGHSDFLESKGDRILRSRDRASTDLDTFFEALEDGAFDTGAEMVRREFAPQAKEMGGRPHSDWIFHRWAELRHELIRKAEGSWTRCVKDHDWEGGRTAARGLLLMKPKDEGWLQKYMEASVKAGFAEDAIRAGAEFEERHQEADWKPDKRTTNILSTARAAIESPRTQSADGSDLVLPRPPLIGRDQERRTLSRTFSRVPGEALQCLLVSGDAGIGKTRLIHEALRGVPLDGQRVLAAEAAELERLIPLNPLIEAFKGLEVRDCLLELEEPWRTVLYGVMPTHFPGEGPIPEAPHIQPGSVPRRLFEAFYQLLLSLVEGSPLVLVVEDLQWVDETTLSVLEFLIRRWEQGRLQLVMSVRSDEVRRVPTLGKFLDNLRLHAASEEIHLGDLDPTDGEALIQNLAPSRLDSDLVAQLQSLAGGNPFFLIELTLEFLAGRLGPLAMPGDLVPIPLSIRQVLDRRLSELSPEAEAVLGAMAVFSRPLDLSALEALTHLAQPDCISALDQLHRFRLVTGHGNQLLVNHELVRQTVYQGLSTTRRAWLHETVGQHLLAAQPPAPAGDLAVHFNHAGVKAKAKAFASKAADRAEAAGAIPEALRFLRIARENSEDPEDIADLIGRMGHLNYLHQNLEEAAPLLELAAQRFRRQGNPARALEAEVERIDCLAQGGRLPLTESLDELERLKQEAREAEEWGVFTKALDVEIHRFDHGGHRNAAKRVLQEAQDCSGVGTPEARCRALAVVALNVYYGSPELALTAAREAVRIALDTTDNELQLHALNRLIVVLLYQGRLHTKEGVEAFQLAESRLSNSGDLILKFFVKLNRAVWHLEVGELSQAKTAFESVHPVLKGTNATDALAWLALNEGELSLEFMDLGTAKDRFGEAERLLRPSSPAAFSTIVNAGLGLCALKSGDLSEARKREADLPSLPDYWTFDPSVIVDFKASMFRRRGDVQNAIDLLAEVADNVKGRLTTVWIKLMIERAKLLRTQRPSTADDVLEEVNAVVVDLGLPGRARTIQRLLDL